MESKNTLSPLLVFLVHELSKMSEKYNKSNLKLCNIPCPIMQKKVISTILLKSYMENKLCFHHYHHRYTSPSSPSLNTDRPPDVGDFRGHALLGLVADGDLRLTEVE